MKFSFYTFSKKKKEKKKEIRQQFKLFLVCQLSLLLTTCHIRHNVQPISSDILESQYFHIKSALCFDKSHIHMVHLNRRYRFSFIH